MHTRVACRRHSIELGGTLRSQVTRRVPAGALAKPGPFHRLLCLLAIGVTTTFRYHTFSWSPWIMIGPGSLSLASSAPPVMRTSFELSWIFWPFSVAETQLPT